MKKIEAIIRKTKFDEVKEALNEVGIDFFSYWDVRGIGQARQERVYRGVVYDTSSIERTKLSIIVRNKNVDKTIKAILATAQTGEIGDGKIFVVDIQQAYRIRTGESGDEALFIKGREE
ncbi:P-II family nitrogen regulator [Prolixibacter sp. SD074]|jgi:nitrogen regulatory protein P-II 1|uniref:P-II family nitrogen regulator n=1 Tax=Prolixibacter sp. SD074 TaxID=2652391 RepID=UPI00126DB197|nr:P-II family nitrogen regulator [Prolixibacter sp. SD074]GET31032.1 nitrogen regulatory protein P-II [Prolixibacter sp. SD074]